MPLAALAVGAIYQYFLVAAFLLARLPLPGDNGGAGAWLGDGMARFFARRVKRGLGPHANVRGVRITADACYPYWYFHLGLTQQALGLKAPPRYASAAAAPACACLFIHGARNPFPLHDIWWARALAERPECAVVAVPTEHWIQHEASPLLNEIVDEWLETGQSKHAKRRRSPSRL